MSNRYVYTIKLLLILFSIITSAASQRSLAILPIAYSGISPSDGKPLTEKIRYEISKDTTYKVMARNEMELMLTDQGFDLSKPCSELACGISIGQLLSVDQLILGTISKINKTYIVSLKLINIGSGSVIRDITENCNVSYKTLLYETLGLIAQKLINPDLQLNVVIKKKRKPFIPILIATLSTAAIGVPGYFIYKKIKTAEPEKRDITVQW